MNKAILDILRAYRTQGWVLEPAAKELFAYAGLPVPRFRWTQSLDEAIVFADRIGYPVVAKIVSAEVVHKSDQGGVAVGVADAGELAATFDRFKQLPGFDGVLVEELASGRELILGAKIDVQFGPVILLGMGGTEAEIYRDTALRMAPLVEADARAMVKSLRASSLLMGYRGGEAVNLPELFKIIIGFSSLVMEIEEYIDSIDLNPLFCTGKTCVIADARIMLRDEIKAS